MSQLVGTLAGIIVAMIGGVLVYGAIKALVGIRLTEDEEYMGADLAIHKVSSSPDNE